MSLKISDNELRFRILPQDLDQLLQGREFSRSVNISGTPFGYRIVPDAQLSLEITGQGLNLQIPRDMLEELSDLGLSKNGLSFRLSDAEVSLQVDIHAKMGRPHFPARQAS